MRSTDVEVETVASANPSTYGRVVEPHIGREDGADRPQGEGEHGDVGEEEPVVRRCETATASLTDSQ
jgi:hypothetical protein